MLPERGAQGSEGAGSRGLVPTFPPIGLEPQMYREPILTGLNEEESSAENSF